jgi:hypothetical protein
MVEGMLEQAEQVQHLELLTQIEDISFHLMTLFP